jgi:hypothetical protein
LIEFSVVTDHLKNVKNMAKEELDLIINNTGLKVLKIIELMKMSSITWYTRKSNPKNFTVEEVILLAKILNKEPEDIFKILIK